MGTPGSSDFSSRSYSPSSGASDGGSSPASPDPDPFFVKHFRAVLFVATSLGVLVGFAVALSFFSLVYVAQKVRALEVDSAEARRELSDEAARERDEQRESAATERDRLWQTGELNKTRLDRHDRLLIELELRIERLEKEP